MSSLILRLTQIGPPSLGSLCVRNRNPQRDSSSLSPSTIIKLPYSATYFPPCMHPPPRSTPVLCVPPVHAAFTNMDIIVYG